MLSPTSQALVSPTSPGGGTYTGGALIAHAEAMFRAEERRDVDVRDLEESQLE